MIEAHIRVHNWKRSFTPGCLNSCQENGYSFSTVQYKIYMLGYIYTYIYSVLSAYATGEIQTVINILLHHKLSLFV